MALRITEAQLREIMPRIKPQFVAAFIAHQSDLDRWGITSTVDRFAMWIANVAHECGEFNTLVENGNYRAEQIVKTWPSRFKSLTAAAPYAKNGPKLFSNVYANRMGNGPESSGDGWNYRGRSTPQVTGKDGYKNVGRVARLDLLSAPDAANFVENLIKVGGAFWEWKVLNRLADAGDFYGLVGRWNGGHIGMAARNAYLATARRVLKQANHVAAEHDESVMPQDVPLPKPRPEQAADAVTVEAAQHRLRELGYWPGNPNGDEGKMTRDAVLAFEADNALPLTGKVTPALMDELAKAGPRYVAPARAEATAETLREKGSETVSLSDRIKGWGKWLVGGGVAAGIGDNSSPLEAAKGYVDEASSLRYMIEPLQEVWSFARENIWLLLIFGGLAVWFISRAVIAKRVEDEQTGANRGR